MTLNDVELFFDAMGFGDCLPTDPTTFAPTCDEGPLWEDSIFGDNANSSDFYAEFFLSNQSDGPEVGIIQHEQYLGDFSNIGYYLPLLSLEESDEFVGIDDGISWLTYRDIKCLRYLYPQPSGYSAQP